MSCRRNGFYDPSEDTFALLDALQKDRQLLLERKPLIALEIGCGSGCVSAYLNELLSSCFLLAIDCNPDAIDATAGLLAEQSTHCVQAYDLVQTDLLGGLQQRLNGAVDLLVCNPPYVPTPSEEVGLHDLTAAWAGGLNGREVIDRVLELAKVLLSPSGTFYLVCIKPNAPQEIASSMRTFGFIPKLVIKRDAGDERLYVIRFQR
mmetsp:Transcript_23147/g.39780  ORF Transcript_23147/g.39780 Transcript_23147/m.39780 type:complete len:205 (+) Transcript_23147:93-707(+)|eukprot:CAMPEP_0196655958 /NCGR_PEP_ID=MMETSP1086-20130531/11811_1 /TAXON_ID=77921 /ORGANISM="Cyanoptyche  gloeocystis , Strain SAG4.97" /LENGTH=204 /DNA_ID=CAMNT_0041988517 /DNA_START=87 /DNA_END=701 /DNA_ORIENTATION=+